MVRRIVWSKRAETIFNKILQFYVERNGSKTYSRKLNSEIKKLISVLPDNPYLGKSTSEKSIRVLIKGDYKIFYKLTKAEIIILLVWDTRQNPKSLKI